LFNNSKYTAICKGINGFIGFNIVYIFGSLSSVYTKNPYSFLPVLVFVVESGYRIPPRECSCQSWFHFSELVTEKLLKYIEHFFHSFSSFPQRNGNNETFVPLQIAVYFELLNKIIYFIYRSLRKTITWIGQRLKLIN
jgi:hypothetical protein